MGYSAFVVEIEKIAPHPNADRLQVATVFGGDVITSLDVQKGWKMVYFPSDGQLSKEFGEYANLLRKKDENGNNIGGYIDPNKRNIKAISLRGSRSDGILVSANIVSQYAGISFDELKPGDSITTLNGKEIVRKYIPVSNSRNAPSTKKKDNQKPKHSYPNFKEHADTKQFRYNLSEFKPGDVVTISLKLHGTSHRVSYTPKLDNTFLGKVKRKLGFKPEYKLVSGTRRVVLDDFKGGYYGTNEFRKQHHDVFEGKLHKGETVYAEIVGYAGIDKTIMATGDNKKLNDKDFVKKYGKTTTFTYGCDNGESDLYIYRMTKTDEDGFEVEYPTWYTQIRAEQMGIKHAPVLYSFVYEPILDKNGEIDTESTSVEFANFIKEFSEGEDLIDPTHIREGVIVRIENRTKFTAFKEKQHSFKVLEGIIKESADEPDMEEAQDI